MPIPREAEGVFAVRCDLLHLRRGVSAHAQNDRFAADDSAVVLHDLLHLQFEVGDGHLRHWVAVGVEPIQADGGIATVEPFARSHQ